MDYNTPYQVKNNLKTINIRMGKIAHIESVCFVFMLGIVDIFCVLGAGCDQAAKGIRCY